VVRLSRVEQRDRVAILQQLTAVLAYQSAVDIRAVAAQVVQIDVPVFVRAADLAVLAAACKAAGEWGARRGRGATRREGSGSQVGGFWPRMFYRWGSTPDPCIRADLRSAFEVTLSERSNPLPQFYDADVAVRR